MKTWSNQRKIGSAILIFGMATIGYYVFFNPPIPALQSIVGGLCLIGGALLVVLDRTKPKGGA